MSKKLGIRLTDSNNNFQFLAGEMDNEEQWDEVGDCKFVSNVIKGIDVVICDGQYIYSVKSNNDIIFDLVDIDNEEILTGGVTLNLLIGTLSDISQEGEDCIKVDNDTDDITITLLGESIKITSTKLISFRKKNEIIKFILNT